MQHGSIQKIPGKKDVVFTLQRYGIDALGAMAQGLFCTLLVGTILNTLGQIGIYTGWVNDIAAGTKPPSPPWTGQDWC